MKHRILHVIASLESSGEASQLGTLASELIAKGHAVRILTLRDGAARGSFQSIGVTVDLLTQRHRIDPLVAGRLRRLARAWRPSVVHAWDHRAAETAHYAGVGPLVVSVTKGDQGAGRFKKGMTKKVDASVACYLAASQTVASEWQAVGHAPDRVRLVPRGVAPLAAAETLSREQAREELGLADQERAIAVVSRLAPTKNLRELIWAADLVRVLNDDARLVIFGDGPVRGELERFARLVGEPGRVRFAGARTNIRSLLPHCEMLWHAGAEPAPPVAVLEAMRAGLPVVADRAPGVEEAIIDQQTGCLVPKSGRAERARVTQLLLEDEARRAGFGQAAMQQAEQAFAAPVMADHAIKAYEQVQPESAGRIAG